MKQNYIRKILFCLFFLFSSFLFKGGYAQNNQCDPGVPYYFVNLTGQPFGSWTSPEHSRNGHCCAAVNDEKCTSFEVLLDTGAAMINLEIISGSVPPGGMYYQVNCGPKVYVGKPICISGVGPHHITFCKEGFNKNIYRISSISKPTFPTNVSFVKGCSKQVEAHGVNESTVTWTSIYPGNQGDYNHYLSCTSGCSEPVVTPDANIPEYMEFIVCGAPIADECGYIGTVCDTVRFNVFEEFNISTTPLNPGYCENSGVQLGGNVSGGSGDFTYAWKNSNGSVVSNSTQYFASSPGIYSFEVSDNVGGGNCTKTLTVEVNEIPLPEVNAGPDITVCSQTPDAALNGSVQNANGGTWSGGNGIFFPSLSDPNAVYSPTQAEINSGSVSLTFTANNAGSGCPLVNDQLTVFFSNDLEVSISASDIIRCFGDSVNLTANISGNYFTNDIQWNTGETNNNIFAGAGNYYVTATDSLGCTATDAINITQPPAIEAEISEIHNVSCYNYENGTATVLASGGSGSFGYIWNSDPNNLTPTASDLSAGTYVVTVYDLNGCTKNVNLVVEIMQPDSIIISPKAFAAKCGQNNGEIQIEIDGGTYPYNYNWNNGKTGNVLKNLSSGVYSVIITDQNNCETGASFTINSIAPMEVTEEVRNVYCFNEASGSINLNVNGGTKPFVYSWNDGNTASQLNNLKAGTYSVNIKDAEGCEVTRTFQLDQNEPILVQHQKSIFINNNNISSTGASDGYIISEATGGLAPYEYTWSNGSSGAEQYNLKAGTYIVTVKDSRGCSKTDTLDLTEPSVLELPNGFSPNADGANDNFVVKGLEDYPDNLLMVFNRWGNEVYSKSNYINDWNGVNKNGEQLVPGVYFILLKVRHKESDIYYKTYVELKR